VATGVVIFGGAGAGFHRRLQQAPPGSQGAKVAYNVLLPASVSVATVLAAVSPSGANAASFVAAVTGNIVAAAAASANPTISSGLGSMTASIPPAAPAAAAAPAPASGASLLAAAIGGAVGGAVIILLVGFAYRVLSTKASKVAPAPATSPSPNQALRVVTASTTQTPPPRTQPRTVSKKGSRSSSKVARLAEDSV